MLIGQVSERASSPCSRIDRKIFELLGVVNRVGHVKIVPATTFDGYNKIVFYTA